MSLLTEHDMAEIVKQYSGGQSGVALWFARAIEATVIEKIKAQGVAAWASDDGSTVIPANEVGYTPNWTDYYRTPLYRLPEGD